jgi:hypothetical protein
MSLDANLDSAEREIEELDRLREELAAAVAELDDVDRQMDEFLGSLS